MNPDCLIKVKAIVNKDTYAKFKEAADGGDTTRWNQLVDEQTDLISTSRRQAIIDANVQADLVDYINAQVAKAPKAKQAGMAAKALSDVISGSGVRQAAGRVSVDKYIDGIRGQYMADLVDGVHASRPKFLGLERSRDGVYSKNLAKAIFGDADASTSKGMQAMSDAWHVTTKRLLERFNKAGGSITELADFNIPVNHYSPKMVEAGEATWIKHAKEFFKEPRKMPGKADITTDELLSRIYKNITTEGNGRITLDELGAPSGNKMGNAHQEFRYLQPKDGDSWLAYNTQYGRHTSPIDAMVEYVDNMATEIGLMETLGTNPTRTLDNLADIIRKSTGNNQAGAMAKASLDQIVARNPGYESKVVDTLRGLRNFQTATKLGMAPLTALTDVGYSAITALFNGAKPLRNFGRLIKNLNPADNADRLLAGRLGLHLDYALSKASAINRYSDINGFGKLYQAADVSVRASGLNHWTNTARMSFGLEMLANMGDHSASPFGSLPKGVRRSLERYGFDKGQWDVVRKSLRKEGGTNYIDPTKMGDDKLSARFIAMVKEETNFAVPEPNAKARATASLGIPRNTLANELIKVPMQFKTFSVSVMMSHLGRAMDLQGMSRVGYMAGLIGTTGALGVTVIQLKEAFKGRTPRPMSKELVMEGLIQGGTMGIAGDLIFNDPTIFGGTAAYLTGPTIGDFNKLKTVLFDPNIREARSVVEAWEKELRPSIAKGILEGAGGMATKLWYTRIALERLLLDDVNKWADPAYFTKMRDQRRWLQKEQGQGFWWEP